MLQDYAHFVQTLLAKGGEQHYPVFSKYPDIIIKEKDNKL